MGRGVKDYRGAKQTEQAVHFLEIPHRRDLGSKGQAAFVFPDQLLLDVVGIVLINIHDDEQPGAITGNLTAQLGADGAAAARNHTHLPLDKGGDIAVVELDGIAPQKILDPDLLHLVEQGSVLQHGVHIGQGLDPTSRGGTDL